MFCLGDTKLLKVLKLLSEISHECASARLLSTSLGKKKSYIISGKKISSDLFSPLMGGKNIN